MENNPFDTSFIPEQPKVIVDGARGGAGKPVNIALLLALVVFFASIATAGAVYFYRISIEKRITQKQVELADKEKNINLDAIHELDHVNRRLSLAKRMLDEHTALSPVLDFLQAHTLKNVGYSSFSLSTKGASTTLSFDAVAPDYNAVYVQEAEFRKQQYVKGVVEDAVALDEANGAINFKLLIDINKDLFNYRKYMEEKATSTLSVEPSATSTN